MSILQKCIRLFSFVCFINTFFLGTLKNTLKPLNVLTQLILSRENTIGAKNFCPSFRDFHSTDALFSIDFTFKPTSICSKDNCLSYRVVCFIP